MCITFFKLPSHDKNEEFPFVIAFNRDEVTTRPSQKAAFLND